MPEPGKEGGNIFRIGYIRAKVEPESIVSGEQ